MSSKFDPEFIGELPIRTDIEILSADDPNPLKLGFTVKEYLGSKCYLASDLQKQSIDTLWLKDWRSDSRLGFLDYNDIPDKWK